MTQVTDRLEEEALKSMSSAANRNGLTSLVP
jgi:hypothetical protein